MDVGASLVPDRQAEDTVESSELAFNDPSGLAKVRPQ